MALVISGPSYTRCELWRRGHRAACAVLESAAIGRLPRFMLPGQVQVVPELPRTSTGKIRMHEPRDRLAPPAR